ncbi:hypothetical protein NLJ89_g8322 [Agrocybe chaxingu]|uniref:CxC2-like cysteine cluster KDZ transposase-associated domain-containing protein n=1 Tax=Agrocybe chaxingu TaxID=84603 RepID=A0A9W8K1Z9_9AGAR|nr:hypothetical protein NLJ89_g8322 [Agrocybe chaxingu]
MSNTRRINAAARKRQRKNVSGAYLDRIQDDDDFTTVHEREARVSSRGAHPAYTTRSLVEDLVLPADDTEYGLDPTDEWYNAEMDRPDIPLTSSSSNIPAKKTKNVIQKRTRSMMSRRPNVVWKDKYRDIYLGELLRWEGRGEFREDGLPSCPDFLLRMNAQWRHLKMLKRGGRGHDPSGAVGTANGELAILCPTCPHPSINLPTGWEEVEDAKRFLYATIYCMDANFRLKNQLVSNWSTDPGFGNDMSYMAPRGPYEKYVLSQADEDDISTCVGFQALKKMDTKFSSGLRYTGVSMVSCGRSEMILPSAVGNLQKGERYANMDYTFSSAISTSDLLLVIISYDIACQWFKNLAKRICISWPDEIKPKAQLKMRPQIPKLHEPGHERARHEQFSCNYCLGLGMTDCECLSESGSHLDMINEHCDFWNWLKYIGIGDSLYRRFGRAVRDRNIQVEGHRGLTTSITADLVVKWEAICKKWEEEPYPKSSRNPYHIKDAYLSEACVRKELAAKEAQSVLKGWVPLHETAPSQFLVMGLDIEETQLRLRRLVKGEAKASDSRGASITQQRNALRTRIRNWKKLQAIYMLGLLQVQTDLEDASIATVGVVDRPEDAQLWLPSAVPENRCQSSCLGDLLDCEERLRTAQCFDALENIRHVLRIKSRMVAFKNKNIRGQRGGTRSRAVIDRIQERAQHQAAKYGIARAAKLALSGPGEWEKTLQVLKDADVCSYQDPERIKSGPGRRGTLEDDAVAAQSPAPSGTDLQPEKRDRRAGTGETRRTLSWIWTTSQQGDKEDKKAASDNDLLLSEWARSRARAMRATEEVALLREEMGRALAFLDWRARWWTTKAVARRIEDPALSEGLVAYATEQAGIQQRLHAKFQEIWKTPLKQSPNHACTAETTSNRKSETNIVMGADNEAGPRKNANKLDVTKEVVDGHEDVVGDGLHAIDEDDEDGIPNRDDRDGDNRSEEEDDGKDESDDGKDGLEDEGSNDDNDDDNDEVFDDEEMLNDNLDDNEDIEDSDAIADNIDDDIDK